ncbi:MAG: glycosyltransferase family 2 protein [Deltaproteobacteria bacterium]|nr:MAG: glycosyltransferase family 2 protein [Deltaproteobacteria bacterium]
MAENAAAPALSVVVRSFRRLDPLLELCRVLAAQDHPSFEVVIVEQTPEPTPEQTAALDALDPRFRVLRFPPLGGPRARNEGVRAAHGEVVVFIDDDDTPVDATWLSEMARHFEDPHLLGVSCRQVWQAGEELPYVSRALVRPWVMRYSRLKIPRTYARFDEDVTPVDWLHGTNSAVRREVALAVGLWDEQVLRQDEHSFAFRLERWRRESGREDGYLAFRARPAVRRGLDIAGGMDKRRATLEGEIANQARFQHNVIGAYYPALYKRFRPVYRAQAFGRVLTWIWGKSRPLTTGDRLRETVQLVGRFASEDGKHRG